MTTIISILFALYTNVCINNVGGFDGNGGLKSSEQNTTTVNNYSGGFDGNGG